MLDEVWIQNFSSEICGREYFETRRRERSVILKLAFKEKAGRLLNSKEKGGRLLNLVVLFRLAMSDGLQPTWQRNLRIIFNEWPPVVLLIAQN
jgi:hypothetical protein